MICPYCRKDMQKGLIRGYKYNLKWIDEDDDTGSILPISTLTNKKGIILKENDELSGGVTAYYCKEDKIFLIKDYN